MSRQLPYLDHADVVGLLSPAAAVAALRATLRDGYRPETDHGRIAEALDNGEFLLMPSETPEAVGIKVLTVAPHNPAAGRARIQGLYLLFDRDSLAPRMLIDGPALTDLRTSAVSIAAVQDAVLRDAVPQDAEPLDVVVYGAGHQGLAHVRTLRAVLAGRRAIRSVTAIVRRPEAVDSPEEFTCVLRTGDAEAEAATRAAGLIMCTTTARTPLFDSELVRADAVVLAVGSHEPDARELDSALMRRSEVIVEDSEVAMRECGDVVMAVEDGALRVEDLLTMGDVVAGRATPRADRPVVFKSSGMPWEDLVIARAIAETAG